MESQALVFTILSYPIGKAYFFFFFFFLLSVLEILPRKCLYQMSQGHTNTVFPFKNVLSKMLMLVKGSSKGHVRNPSITSYPYSWAWRPRWRWKEIGLNPGLNQPILDTSVKVLVHFVIVVLLFLQHTFIECQLCGKPGSRLTLSNINIRKATYMPF